MTKNLAVLFCFFIASLDLQKYDGGLVTIQNPKSKRYIAMNSNGTIYSTVGMRTLRNAYLTIMILIQSAYYLNFL